MADTEATRGPECAEKIWDEQVDGAWAPCKAPVSLLTAFLKCIQERDSVEAELAALKILEAEPDNRLVRDLLDAVKQQDALEADPSDDGEEEDDSSEGDDEDESEEEGDDDEGDDEEAEDDANDHEADAKSTE
ncbi:hypothetical protein PHYBOEH_000866 [Phytophthora boehmeriae]|uniref:Uncharacterized protein n=1 Tax=Phytophthora boehmeriae TaxID=109152 RepID=A0A8T1WX43_9STRA|nr:hypothetical protein PHYBOEH_000866 [Phytophthora boehmeriae]